MAVRRILIVEDDPLAREAYRAFLGRQPDIQVVGEVPDGSLAVQAYADLQPDLVLMDLQLPGQSGVVATEQICARWPDACVLVLTTFGTRDHIVPALRAGASGYLVKDAGGPALLAAMRAAQAGDMPLSSEVRRQLVATVAAQPAPEASDAPEAALTPREIELLGWLALGLTNAQIAQKMYLSEGSVKQYLSHITDKWGLKTRTQVIVRSIQVGVVDPHALPPIGAES